MGTSSRYLSEEELLEFFSLDKGGIGLTFELDLNMGFIVGALVHHSGMRDYGTLLARGHVDHLYSYVHRRTPVSCSK
jgi:hypothetical protein